MTEADQWVRYLGAAQRLHDVRRLIAAIGVKSDPTPEELESLTELLEQHDEALEAVNETSEIGLTAHPPKAPWTGGN